MLAGDFACHVSDFTYGCSRKGLAAIHSLAMECDEMLGYDDGLRGMLTAGMRVSPVATAAQ